MNDKLKPNFDDMLYTNSCGRIYRFGFELLVNNDYLFYPWQVVDAVSFEKKNKINMFHLALILIIITIAIPFNLYLFPQTDWVINGGFIAALLIAVCNMMKQVPLIIIKFKDGEYKINQIPPYQIDIAKDFTRMIKKSKDKNYFFNNFEHNDVENRSMHQKQIEVV